MTDQINWKEVVQSKSLQPHEVDCVIYHHPCSDGTGSAYVAWKYFTQYFPDKQISYFPMSIGAPPPVGIEGKNVLICDYSYRKEVLTDLLKKVNKLLLIDHHASAEKDLKDLDDNLKIFHMKFSGAMLTWYYFFPEVPPPLLIQYIQDRDIWTKLLPNTDDFASWFYTLPLDVKEYDKYLDDALLLEMINVKGKSFGELNNYYSKQSVDYCVPKFCRIKDKFYFVGYVNSTVCKSDIGNQIFDKFPMIDFSAVYSISDSTDSTSFSLRSTPKHANVSDIAFSLGGGGHQAASGVKVNYVTNHLPGEVYDNGRLYAELHKLYYDIIEINGKVYNVVYLPSNVYKTKLGMYLLQSKYIDNVSKKLVQVCRDISQKLTKPCPETVNIAAVWSYSPIDDETDFSIVLDKSITEQEKSVIDAHFTTDTSKGIVYKGIHYRIPVGQSVVMKEIVDE
jgi:oligoribonuclease NrnB/cAMP/cGMP phosphodiesterase (DHH superfamily)